MSIAARAIGQGWAEIVVSDAGDGIPPDFVAATARYWTRFGGGSAVEPLEIVRESTELARNYEQLKVEHE